MLKNIREENLQTWHKNVPPPLVIETRLILGSKGQRERSRGKKQGSRGFCTLVSAGFF